MLRTLTLFALTSALSVALACPGGKCNDDCKKEAAASTTSTDVQKAEGTKATFTVGGMHCASCSDKAAAAFLGVPGVNAASVDLATGKASVSYDSAKTNVDAMIKAVATNTHFTVTADK